MIRKTIEVVCVVCVGFPCFIVGYLAQFARAGFHVGLNFPLTKSKQS